MNRKRILVLDGHPGGRSLSGLFTKTYADAAVAAGHDVRHMRLSDMQFDMDFGDGGYKNHKPLEPVLEDFLTSLEWAEHFVVSTPMWWGGLPAKLKGLFDRTLLPGRAFDTRVTKMGMPTPMLTGKTARVILTSDTPMWAMRWLYRRALMHQTTNQVMKFCGLKPTRYTYFSGATNADAPQVSCWSKQLEALGGSAA
ncbi:NAD(P)H-dependent oxidoreductase [uncultured Litoreibacter sp.]|uniref:NAD(P)H-dependent oxidoreductase n=1 Tax=uncultured Litoreibacter sp. TaxID=1392394 RepID=UPI00262AF8D5|nr:NAD(P)H-dependent oxidoreductase [uncultured Litoreibacter sp.]